MARNTAPACALAAFLLEQTAPETVIGVFPSDHVSGTTRFCEVIRAGIELAASGERIVVLGVPPTRAETGYGYIELGEVVDAAACPAACAGAAGEAVYGEAGPGAGEAVCGGGELRVEWRHVSVEREHAGRRDPGACPAMVPLLEKIAAAYGTAEFERGVCRGYPQCENISVDYAVLEPRSAKGEAGSEIYCLPADFAWNDLGSWASLHEHLADGGRESGGRGASTDGCVIDAEGNYVYAPGKVVALLGVATWWWWRPTTRC